MDASLFASFFSSEASEKQNSGRGWLTNMKITHDNSKNNDQMKLSTFFGVYFVYSV